MDYEKKYKEAMLRADEAVQKGCLDKDMFDIIFPPEESEDERIRKMCITAVNIAASADGGLLHSEASECLTWLEEQKDKNCLACDQHLKGYIAGRKATEEEKQKEQKPVETSDFKTKLAEYLQNNSPKDGQYVISSESILEMAKEELIKRGELQKPVEWTDEDERVRKALIDLVSTVGEYYLPKLEARNKMLAYLEKQKEQKPAWSEEEDQLIGFIFDLLNDLFWRKDWAMSKEECLERLKSLRPQWKPTEEQMEALQRAIDACESEWDYQDDELRSLLNDLKKLYP